MNLAPKKHKISRTVSMTYISNNYSTINFHLLYFEKTTLHNFPSLQFKRKCWFVCFWAADTRRTFLSAPGTHPNPLSFGDYNLQVAFAHILFSGVTSSTPLSLRDELSLIPLTDTKVLGLGFIFFLFSNALKPWAKSSLLCPLCHPLNPHFFSQTPVSLFLTITHTRSYNGTEDKLKSLEETSHRDPVLEPKADGTSLPSLFLLWRFCRLLMLHTGSFGVRTPEWNKKRYCKGNITLIK